MMRMSTGTGLRAADAVDHALLDGAQELGLQAHVHLGDLVEQQRAAGRLLELADAAGDRAGEGALLVAEQLGFEQVLRDRRAVDRDERRRARGSSGVDVAREHLLAGAGLAGDQHRGVARRDLLGELDHVRHRLVAIDQLAGVVGDGREHRRDQLRIGRQRDVFLGAGVDGGDRGARVVARCRRRRSARGCARPRAAAPGRGCRARRRPSAGRRRGRSAARRAPARCVSAWVTLAPLSIAILVAVVSWPLQGSDDQEAHGSAPCFRLSRMRASGDGGSGAAHQLRSALMISVMVTPSLSSTSTTSPRATRRLLT